LIIATVIYVFAPFSRLKALVKSEEISIEYTIEVLGVDQSLIDKIQENDAVLDAVSKNTLGTVIAVDNHTEYQELHYKENQEGKPEGVLVDYPEKYNIIITVTATADYAEESGYSIHGRRIAVGEKMSLRFPDYACEGYCISVRD
jgi:hypothetical protein